MPPPQNMKAKLKRDAAASSIVIENGIMQGQNEMARVPNAAAKISHHVEWNSAPATANALRRHECHDDIDHREDEQVWPLEPSTVLFAAEQCSRPFEFAPVRRHHRPRRQ